MGIHTGLEASNDMKKYIYARVIYVNGGVCSLIPGSGVIVHIYVVYT